MIGVKLKYEIGGKPESVQEMFNQIHSYLDHLQQAVESSESPITQIEGEAREDYLDLVKRIIIPQTGHVVAVMLEGDAGKLLQMSGELRRKLATEVNLHRMQRELR